MGVPNLTNSVHLVFCPFHLSEKNLFVASSYINRLFSSIIDTVAYSIGPIELCKAFSEELRSFFLTR